MSTLVCCEPVSARPRDNLKLALNRSLSEPGPPSDHRRFLLTTPTSPTLSTISTECSSSQDASSTSGSGGSTNSIDIGDDCLSTSLQSLHHRLLHHHRVSISSSTILNKRCKLETVSLPTSPCNEGSPLQRQLILHRTRTINADELATRIQHRPGGLVLLDCRPFTVYNANHVRGAINVNCSDRFNRKRLQQRKSTLADLAGAWENKELLKDKNLREVIIYDDSTADLDLPDQHPLFLMLTTLVNDDRDPTLLLGEFITYY